LARSSTQRVMSGVGGKPPLLGLYLKPPSSGGLCDGVITMPVREVLASGRGYRRGWRERITGVWRDAVVSLNYCIHVVGRQNPQVRCALGRFGHWRACPLPM